MPQRFLRPGIRTSAAWNHASFPAQSLYVAIMTLVDDWGRYDGRPALLHGECFSLRDDIKPQRTAALLTELHQVGLIRLYEIDGKAYLQVEKWSERVRGSKSRFPDPPQESAAFRSIPQEKDASLATTPSPIHHRHSSDIQAVAWSEQTGWVNVEALGKDFGEAYPACNFTRQLKQADCWLRANPRKAKKDNWLKFLTNWFKRSQDRGGDIASNKPGPNGAAPENKTDKLWNEIREKRALKQ